MTQTLGGRPNLRAEIVTMLRAAVISGEMRPDTVYSAVQLALQYGVSATPVREAMLDLAKEGLVEVMRNKGFRVTRPSEQELDDLTGARLLLEVPTTLRVAEIGLTAADLTQLAAIAEAIVAAAAETDLSGYLDADTRFHLSLLALAGNREVVEIVRQLRTRSRMYGLPELAARGELTGSAHEHHELLELISAQDIAGTDTLIRRHIGHVRTLWAGR